MNQAAKTKKIFDGRYEILSIVGRGARSVVYHARHVSSPSSEVALKVLLNQKGRSPSGERLRKEALAMVSSRHKYVVRLDDFHSVGSLCYLSMEYAPEADLRRYVKKLGGTIPVQQGEMFLLQIAEALSFIHRAGILHRDLKPDNILVVNDNEIRIADFGVAVLPGEGATLEDLQSGVGTMNYMAPEVLDGRGFDARSDIYSVGVMFYEILGGTNPFERTPLAQQLEARRDEKVQPLHELNPNVPVYLSQVISQAMSYDPNKRFPSARELAQAILINRASSQIESPSNSEGQAAPEELTAEIIAQANTDTIEPEPFMEESAIEAQIEDDRSDLIEQPASDRNEPSFNESYDQHIQPHEQHEMSDTVYIPADKADSMRRELQARSQRKAFLKTPLGIMSAGAAIAAALYILPLLARGIGAIFTSLISSESDVSGGGAVESALIPPVQSEDFSFPTLPSGLYIGSITGIFPSRTAPLAIVSFENRDELTFIFGIEGLSPVTIKPRQLVGDVKPDERSVKPLRIASNGIMIQLTGQNVDGEIYGYFKNLLNGEEGEWNARPVRGTAANGDKNMSTQPQPLAAEHISGASPEAAAGDHTEVSVEEAQQ